MHEWEFVSENESDSARLGAALGQSLVPGSIVALVGDLGAGKTFLVRSIAEALGVDTDLVGSPTFVLIHEYAGRLPVYHFDVYRLVDLEEFLELGAEELLTSDGVCLIEWADRVTEALPADRLEVRITATGESTRELKLLAGGTRSANMLRSVRQTLDGSDSNAQ